MNKSQLIALDQFIAERQVEAWSELTPYTDFVDKMQGLTILRLDQAVLDKVVATVIKATLAWAEKGEIELINKNNWDYGSNFDDLVKKLNEIIDAVNRLKAKP